MINHNYQDSSADLFQQYKLYVESAEKNSDRRAVANRFMVAINSVVFSAFLYGIVYFFKAAGEDAFNLSAFLLLVFVFFGIGSLLSLYWNYMLNSYAKISKIKFAIIGELEDAMPATLYKSEWERLKADQYEDITTWECRVPIILLVLYVTIFVLVFVWAIVSGCLLADVKRISPSLACVEYWLLG